jgi:hypothetical protein
VRSDRINIRQIFVLTGVLSLFVIYAIIWGQMIVTPSERTGTDFIAFYTAGRVAQENGLANTYDVALQREIQEKEVGFHLGAGRVLLYNHMPYLIPVLQVLVSQSYVNSFVRWLLLLIALYAFGMYGLKHWFPDDFQPSRKYLFLAGAATFFPVFVSLLLGQDTAFLFMGVSLIGWGISRKKYWLAGAGLALTTVRPHFVILFAVPLLFSQRKVFGWFLIFTGSLAIMSMAILGIQGTKDFINILLISAGGEWYGMKEGSMYNLIGLLSRRFTFLNPATIRTIGWIVYMAAILAIFIWSARTRKIKKRDISWIVLVCTLTVPHFHYHDLTLLLFPLLIVGSEGQRLMLTRGFQFMVQPLVISLIMLVGFFDQAIQFVIPYFIVAGLAILLFRQNLLISKNLEMTY